MTTDRTSPEPSPESLEELPEVDFSRALRPNRLANVRGAFAHAIFLDRELWEHFGSEEQKQEWLPALPADLRAAAARLLFTPLAGLAAAGGGAPPDTAAGPLTQRLEQYLRGHTEILMG